MASMLVTILWWYDYYSQSSSVFKLFIVFGTVILFLVFWIVFLLFFIHIVDRLSSQILHIWINFIFVILDNKKFSSSSQSNIVTCPVCKETVAGQRFAPHLEKCLNGGKRGGLPSKKTSGTGCSSNDMGIGLPYYSQIKKVDPYPLSLIVRVRLKDGCKSIISVIFLSICVSFYPLFSLNLCWLLILQPYFCYFFWSIPFYLLELQLQYPGRTK